MAWVVVALPPAPFWKNQAAYEVAFGTTWRIALASMIAYFCGEFVELLRAREDEDLRPQGRWLWTRTIGSTIVGEAVDSLALLPARLLRHPGIIPNDKLPTVMLAQFVAQGRRWRCVFTPVTYKIVGVRSSARRTRTTTTATPTSRPFTLKT